MVKSKTIKVSSQTYARLAKQGTLVDSFDKVIQRLLEQEQEQGSKKTTGGNLN